MRSLLEKLRSLLERNPFLVETFIPPARDQMLQAPVPGGTSIGGYLSRAILPVDLLWASNCPKFIRSRYRVKSQPETRKFHTILIVHY